MSASQQMLDSNGHVRAEYRENLSGAQIAQLEAQGSSRRRKEI